jgi:16S rRNA (cytidine1402-2'-O)-methyltransferase
MLYIIPTPIGNLEDITLRSIRLLSEVDLILAEDTRTSGKLLSHYDITTPMQSFHSHNEHKKVGQIVDQLIEGKDIALISDAGTPGISDPGFLLSRACMESDVKITCLPGPTALIPAIVMSGLPCDKFFFEGFLPQKKGKKTRIEFLLSLPVTFAFYESPFRVLKTIEMIQQLSEKDRLISISREISKIYEEVVTLSLSEMIQFLKDKKQIKGEFVVIVQGATSK